MKKFWVLKKCVILKTGYLKWHHLTDVSPVAKSLLRGWGTGLLPVRTCMGAHGHAHQTTRPGTVLFPGVASVYALRFWVCDYLCLSPCPHTQTPGLTASQADFQFALNLRMALSFWFSYLYFLSTGTKGILYHAWFLRCWESKLRPHSVRQARCQL